MLFGGPFGGRYSDVARPLELPPVSGADLGPGMVESPYHPGQCGAVDPRYMKQEVSYDGTRSRRHHHHQHQRAPALSGAGQRPGDALRHRRRPPGFTWAGTHHITNKREWPDWTPPDEMLKRRPDLPRHMDGGPDNPLGARAMYLGSTLYRIHGSNEPWTIGTRSPRAASACATRTSIDLYGRVKVGTKVVVI